MWLILLPIVIAFALIAVHETGHYLAGWLGGIPAGDMRIVLLAFPQHVALRDGDSWVSPVHDIERYVGITYRHFGSRRAAFGWVAGGMVVELIVTGLICLVASLSDWRGLAFWVACMSLGLYIVNVFLMNVPWAIRYSTAAGDTSGLWQIAKLPAVIVSLAMFGSRVALVALTA
jgi:hypothetical protein